MYSATFHHCRVWILKMSRKIRAASHSLPSQCIVAASAAESHQLVTQEKSWQLPLTVQLALIWIPVNPVWVTKHVAWAKYTFGGISPTKYGHRHRNIVKVCVKYLVSRPLNSCPWPKDFNQSFVGALMNIIVIFKCQCHEDDDGTFDTDIEWEKTDFQKLLKALYNPKKTKA